MDEALRNAEKEWRANPQDISAYQAWWALHLRMGGRDPKVEPIPGDWIEILDTRKEWNSNLVVYEVKKIKFRKNGAIPMVWHSRPGSDSKFWGEGPGCDWRLRHAGSITEWRKKANVSTTKVLRVAKGSWEKLRQSRETSGTRDTDNILRMH